MRPDCFVPLGSFYTFHFAPFLFRTINVDVMVYRNFKSESHKHPNEIGRRAYVIIFIKNAMYITVMYIKFNDYGANDNAVD